MMEDTRNDLLGKIVHVPKSEESVEPTGTKPCEGKFESKRVLPHRSVRSKAEPIVEAYAAPNTSSGDFQRLPFPMKLHRLLDEAEEMSFDDIISWTPNGKFFTMHDPESFEQHVMPRYFSNQSRYKSFMRQLHLYGFRRITKGPHKGSRHHKMFMRNEQDLCMKMITLKMARKQNVNPGVHSSDESHADHDDGNSTDSSYAPPGAKINSNHRTSEKHMEGNGFDFQFDPIPLSDADPNNDGHLDEAVEPWLQGSRSLPGSDTQRASSQNTPRSDDLAKHYAYLDSLFAQFQKTQEQIQRQLNPPGSRSPDP